MANPNWVKGKSANPGGLPRDRIKPLQTSLESLHSYDSTDLERLVEMSCETKQIYNAVSPENVVKTPQSTESSKEQ